MTLTSGSERAGRTLQDRAYNYIKSAILNMDLRPGQPLVDSELAEHIQVSRTPVREALRQLEREGLVIHVPRRGWHVHSLTLEDIHHIFDIKEELEGFTARRVAEVITPEDAERLMRILEGMEEAARRNDLDEWIVRDKEWHDLVFSILGNDRLEAIIHNLNDQWHRLRVGHIALGGRLQKSCAEHREISEAICAGDAERAERAMKDHLHGLRESLVNVLENLLLPFVGDRI